MGFLASRNAPIDPMLNVCDDALPSQVVEQIVKVTLVELESLVGRAGHVVEPLAAARLRCLVERAVQDEHWKRDERELLLQPLVGADHRRYGLNGLNLPCDERVVVHRLNGRGIAGKVLVLQLKDMRMRQHVAQALEYGKGEIRRRQFVGETLADQARELGLVLE